MFTTGQPIEYQSTITSRPISGTVIAPSLRGRWIVDLGPSSTPNAPFPYNRDRRIAWTGQLS